MLVLATGRNLKREEAGKPGKGKRNVSCPPVRRALGRLLPEDREGTSHAQGTVNLRAFCPLSLPAPLPCSLLPSPTSSAGCRLGRSSAEGRCYPGCYQGNTAPSWHRASPNPGACLGL